MMIKKLLVSSMLVCVLMLSVGTAHAGENWIGSWKFDPAKSKVSTGGVGADTLKFEATPAGIVLTSQGTDANGKPTQGTYTSKFDGTEVPWTGNPLADTASPKKIDD